LAIYMTCTGLDLADSDKTHLFVASDNWHAEREVEEPLRCTKIVQGVEKRVTLVVIKNTRGNLILNIVTTQTRNWHEFDDIRVESDLLQIRRDLVDALLIPGLTPFDSRIVHFIDDDNELPHTRSLCQQKMLASLTTLLKPSFEFSFTC